MKNIFKFDSNPRTRMLVCATAAVVFIFMFEKFFFAPLRVRIKSIDKEMRLKEVELKSGIVIQNKKDTIMAEYQAYKNYLNDNTLSDADNVANFLKEVESIAQRSRVSIVNLTPGEKTRLSGSNKVFYADARIEATLEQFLVFLNAIQSSKLLITVDKLAVTVKDESASSLRVDATISMTVL